MTAMIDWSKVIPPQARAEAALLAHKDTVTAAIDAHVEARARAMGYNGAAHLASYAASTVPQWAAEAHAFVAWRDAVWVAAFGLLEAVVSGEEAPSLEAALAALPGWEG